jgi:hypothetical protein
LIALLGAVLFIVFMIGVALVVVLPTLFFTTFAASFLFLWGLGGYYLLKWCNEGEQPAEAGKGIGDVINNFTGGRMNWLVDGTRKKQEDIAAGVDKTPKMHGNDGKEEKGSNGQANGGPPKLNAAKNTGHEAKEQAAKHADGVQKRVTKGAGDTTSTASTAKTAASGATSAAT